MLQMSNLQNLQRSLTIVVMVVNRVQLAISVAILALFTIGSATTSAQEPQSTNYRFDETSIGTGGFNESSSANFNARVGIGDLVVGRSESSSYNIEQGSRTDADPFLKVTVTDASAEFGYFSPSTPATATATFEVVNYTSYGYAVQIIGDPPTFNGNSIAPLTSNAVSAPGSEQFGLNLVANTSPSVGTNPDNGTAPNDFGYGQAATNYNTANSFRYVEGETVALAPKSSGKTIYTISYLVNVGSRTAAGQYTAQQSVVVTGTY